MNSEWHCENVLCDVHLQDLWAVEVLHSLGVIHKLRVGFGKCPVSRCRRFFGTEGYCDLTSESEFANVRTDRWCPNQHEPTPMYIQRRADRLLWVCPLCQTEGRFPR